MLRILGRATSTNVQKVLWCCDEIGLAYEREDIGGPFGGNREPAYLALNPNGLVPTIVDDGFVLWESNTIVRYLAATYGAEALLPAEPRRHADIERWMDWELSAVLRPHGNVFRQLIRTAPAERDSVAIESDRLAWAAALTVLDTQLAHHDFVAGPSLTAADLAIGPSMYRWYNLDIERPDLPRLEAWYRRLCDRPPYRAHVMIEMV